MSYIAELLKNNFLNSIPTTKDLIYKENIINVNNIIKSYDDLTVQKKYHKVDLNFGKNSYYISNSSEFLKIIMLNGHLTNEIVKITSPNDAIESFMLSEIFNSLWIEGVRSSKKIIKQFLKDKNIDPKIETEKLARNFADAINFVFSTNTINEPLMFALYQILSRDVHFGENILEGYPYRLEDVQIGKENNLGIAPNLIKSAMDSMFQNIGLAEQSSLINTTHFVNALLFHYHFELVHPYYDMNGRMGRLLSLWYANKFDVFPHLAFLSEAIHLFKDEFYYSPFKKSEINDFKFDATYFVASVTCALVGQKIIFLAVDKIKNEIKNKFNKVINSLQIDIVIALMAKEKDNFYKTQDFILGVEQINPSQISQALQELVEFGVLFEINSKPKEYKLVWTDLITSTIDKLIKLK